MVLHTVTMKKIYFLLILCYTYEKVIGDEENLKCSFYVLQGRPHSRTWCSYKNVGNFDLKQSTLRQVTNVIKQTSSNSSPAFFIQPNEREGSFSSPLFNALQTFCLVFKYYIFGGNGTRLSVDTSGEETDSVKMLFYRDHKSDNVDKWHTFERTVQAHSEQLRYNFRLEQSKGSAVAIGNIATKRGECEQVRNFCDFDMSASGEFLDCSWLTVGNAGMAKWSVVEDNASATNHSSQSTRGGVLTIVDIDKADEDVELSLTFPYMDSRGSKSHCLSFWMIASEQTETRLVTKEIGFESEPTESIVWTFADNGHDSWSRYLFTLTTSGERSFLVATIKVKNFPNQATNTSWPVTFDSLSFEPGDCPKPVDCDFEEHMCGWTVQGARFLIGTGRLAEPTKIVGNFAPPASETRFAYVDFTNSDMSQESKMTSELVEKTGEYCLTYKYFTMLLVRFFSTRNLTLFHVCKLVAGKSCNDENSLLKSDVTLVTKYIKDDWATHSISFKSSKPFRILFEVSTDGQGTSFFAIDDVVLEQGRCAGHSEIYDNAHSGPATSDLLVISEPLRTTLEPILEEVAADKSVAAAMPDGQQSVTVKALLEEKPIFEELSCSFKEGTSCQFVLSNSDDWTFDKFGANTAGELSLVSSSGHVRSQRIKILEVTCMEIHYYLNHLGSTLKVLMTDVQSGRSEVLFATAVGRRWRSKKVTLRPSKNLAMITITATRAENLFAYVILGSVEATLGKCA